MGGPKTKVSRGFSAVEREFCVKEYYKNEGRVHSTQYSYWSKFGMEKQQFPTEHHIMAFVLGKTYEDEQISAHNQTEEQQKTETSKLSGTKWGRKTALNRIVRTDSVDMGAQQAIKWKERDAKWSGPRSLDKKQSEVPVINGRPYWWYYYNELSIEEEEEEVKPDKRQVLKEKFEGEVLDLIESLDASGHAARASAFVSLRAALQRRAVDGLLAAHRATLADHVSRALRRGKDAERKAAAAVVPLLALQIGEDGSEQFMREVRPALKATAADKSASLDTRTECCSSLAVLCYMVEEDQTEILEVMRMFETIFSGSYLEDEGSVNESAVEEGAWHAAALDGWALLLPLLSPNHALSLLNNQEPSFARLGELLEAVSLEVRMAAGGALAITYETVSDDNNSYNPLEKHVEVLLPRLTELVRDSHKYHAKRDRRVQRATFRDILRYFEEGSAPCGSAHMGTETAAWRGWSRGAAHAALAGALGGALQVLAPHTARLRARLQLADESSQESEPEDKPRKLQQEKTKKKQRHLQNKATSKARKYSRNKNRDERSSALAT